MTVKYLISILEQYNGDEEIGVQVVEVGTNKEVDLSYAVEFIEVEGKPVLSIDSESAVRTN